MSSEIVFGLETAPWPALLVDGTRGTVVRANASALSTLSSVLSGDMPPFAAIWSKDNPETSEQFFQRWEQKPFPMAQLKFQTSSGVAADFPTSICAFSRDNHKWFVLQMLPAAAAAPATNAVEKDAAPDQALIHKQKLDRALQLARTISLDFNNVLTSILGHTSLLLSKAEAGHPWRNSLLEVEKSAARAAEISNELGQFSQPEKQQNRRVPPANLNAVTLRCVEFFKSGPGSKISWNLNLEKELFGSRFEEAKIQQALTKVLENAVEAVNGSGEIMVQTRNLDLTSPSQDRNVKLAAGSHICVEVCDNGAGIDPVNLPRVFEPFFTTKKAPHRGLGLALVYGIVSNHGGGVVISSEPGKGASARIYLPAEKQLINQSSAGPDENLRGVESILVVDDEAMLLTMAETVLTENGYKVLTANSGQKALALLAKEDVKVDLLVTDLIMPAMAGRELIERANKLKPKLKVLCMSGGALSPEEEAGFVYLQKPFTSRDLLVKTRDVLGKK